MEGKNDTSAFLVILILCLIALIWAGVRCCDGTRFFDVEETSVSSSLASDINNN